VLEASTHLGGKDWEHLTALCCDGGGHVYAAGTTSSSGYPATLNGFGRSFDGVLGFCLQRCGDRDRA